MKCSCCGHESKEKQAKFCCECGQKLCPSISRSVNPGGDQTSTALNLRGPGNELIDDITNTSGADHQSEICSNEPQSLKNTDPPIKKKKKKQKRKKKESIKKTGSDSTTSLITIPADQEDPSITQSNGNDDDCGSLADSVTAENAQPTAQTIENTDATNQTAESGEVKTEVKDDENSSKGNAVLISIKDKHEDGDREPRISMKTELSTSSRNEDPESTKTGPDNVIVKDIGGKESSINHKMADDQTRELRKDISCSSNVHSDMEDGGENDTPTPNEDTSSTTPDSGGGNQISEKSAASGGTPDVDTRADHDKTNNDVPSDHKDNKKDIKVTDDSNLKGGFGKKADGDERMIRKHNPDDSIAVYFHVIVSKKFDLNINGDAVIVRGGWIEGWIEGYQAWKDAICTMICTKDLPEESGFLYEGHTCVPKTCMDKNIPYKYVIVSANGKEEYEYIHSSANVNRCLYIWSKCVQGNEWHQYDDMCMKDTTFLGWSYGNQNVAEAKKKAGKVMLSEIFSIPTNYDAINMYNFYIQLNQFYAVYTNPLLLQDNFGAIQQKTPGFGESEVQSLIFNSLLKMCEPFLGKKKLHKDDIKERLIVGLVFVLVLEQFGITIKRDNMVDVCSCLCLDEMPREKMIEELHRAKKTFHKMPWLGGNLRTFCQVCIDNFCDEWVWVIPVLHAFSAASNPVASYKTEEDRQEDIWAGLEGLAYDRVKQHESDILKKMVAKKYLLQVDPLLIQSWLCLIPLNYMEEFLEKIPVRIVCALRACSFKFSEANYTHREKAESILKKLKQLQDTPPKSDAIQMCCKASLDLHEAICCNVALKIQHQLPALSAEIILMLLPISGLPQQQAEDESESNPQPSDTEKALKHALSMTTKWLKDVYGDKFQSCERSFHSELSAWNLIIKAGENATLEWKDALVSILFRKIKQEEAFHQIYLYCKEQETFKRLHPSIHTCFEECAIEAVPFTPQPNILSMLKASNLRNCGRLVSSIIEYYWPKDNQGSHIRDSDDILQHLLTWADATYIFQCNGMDTKSIPEFGNETKELVALAESVMDHISSNVIDGTVLFKHMESILKHKEQFGALYKLRNRKEEKPPYQVLKWREAEMGKVQEECDLVTNLLQMIRRVDKRIEVNVSEIHSKHSQELGPQKLIDILPIKTSNNCAVPDLSYCNLSAPSMAMAGQLHTFKDSHIFTTCWERQAKTLCETSHEKSKAVCKISQKESEALCMIFDEESEDFYETSHEESRVLCEPSHEESSDEEKEDTGVEFTVEQIINELFNPCLENYTTIYNDLKSGEVTFETLDVFLSDFKGQYDKLKQELEIFCHLEDRNNGGWISARLRQIEQYHQLDVAFRSAEVISEVKTFFGLTGDFRALEVLLQSNNFESYKLKRLSCINEEVMKTKNLLEKMNENHIACLQEVLLSKAFFLWVKEALEDVNELKVFVDLASISAGENDMDVDRVSCFHGAVLGCSPLLYELKSDFGFDQFMECLEKLWKALKSDPKLPDKLRDSARHIEWLKTVKESHGSVELSSLALATTINQKGKYIIRAPKDSKKITPNSVLHLVLPENEEITRCYTLEELEELLNKLMLISGKGEQSNSEVDKFSEIFSNVRRLARSFIDLYLAGNMLFRTWEAEIHCADNARFSVSIHFDVEGIDDLRGEETLTDLLPNICKTMESFLEEWLAFVNEKRSKLYYLNFYTTEQLVYLCQQYQMSDISEEALVMLSFIKPNCTKIDVIGSFYVPNTSSLDLTTEDQQDMVAEDQPDMVGFATELEDCTDASKKLKLVWKFSMGNMSSLFPGCLDLDTLGTNLAALADLNKPIVRELQSSLQPGRPNLILCPPSEMLSCAMGVYMHSSSEPLPSYDEVLLCTPHTTYEEVALFFRRCLTLGYKGSKIYSLIHADQLSYDVGYNSELLFQHLKPLGINDYNLVIICNSDREHCYIPSVFSQFKIHVIPQVRKEEINHYLCTHFKVGSGVVSAASVFKDGMSAGIVSSKRAGVGKSLYVKRLYQKLQSSLPNKPPHLKIIRLIKPEVDENKVLETLLPFTQEKWKNCRIIFHIDVTSSVKSGISEFLFKLLILQYLMDSQGRIWKRLPSHLYIIEMLEASDFLFGKQFKSIPRIVQNGFIDFFPKIFCCSPKEVLTRITQTDVTDCGDPGMDKEEFSSECFQRPYQYLNRFDQRQNLDAFVYNEDNTEGDPAKCLQIFLLYCGVLDPSWSELRNFAWFLNLQLRDCEASVFCNHEFVGDTLQGFKNFVVNFMIQMAKDFATPSLHIADQSPGRCDINLDGVKEQDLLPFLMRKRWESESHPYIFFNEDHASMTFIGFHLQPNNVRGVDAICPRDKSIIKQNVMSLQLYSGLKHQGVPFNTNFDQLLRHEKISRLCMVLGIPQLTDPDETYELTLDNILKILAIKMRFRCGIPVVIMGETGCGKTRLIKFLCQLCKGSVETENMKLVKVHGGTTAETIYQKILEAQKIAQINKEKGCETVLFFDEANTTEAISSIKEALCDHTVEGVPLQEDSGLHIIAACNPYRKHTDDMINSLESAGLGYRVRADETKERLGSIPLRQLVYRVHALPPSMMPLVWDFGQLNNETEKNYIQQIVLRLAKEICLSDSDIQLLTNVLSASQSYMRSKNDECSFVSLRDVERCIEVFKWFHSHCKKLMQQRQFQKEGKTITSSKPANKAAWSLVLAVGVCYLASLETKDLYTEVICKYFPVDFRDPDNFLKEITSIQDLFLDNVKLRKTIAKNLALKENLFMMVICIELRIPLFLVGKPGSSKSLAKTIVADAMQGQAAHTKLYKDLKQIHLVSFQCSPHSTPEGIIGIFRQCARFQEGKNLNEYVSVVVLDEIGLAEDSPKMPLKTLHPLLEDGCIDDDTSPHKKVGFIGISNWALDPAKMNRGIFVCRGDPNKEELIESAMGICSSDSLILRKVSQYFDEFSEAYLGVCKILKEQEKEFFGLRDFYSLIKMVFAFTKQSNDSLKRNEIARAVLRNFSGNDDVNALEMFLGKRRRNIEEIKTTDLIMENIRSDSDDCRYLLILTKNYAALQILQQAFLKESQQPEIIFGSSFSKDQEYTQICRNINRVKICMETGQMVILLNLQNLYESLYDALNQYYVFLAGQKYIDLGLGTHRVKCRVHPKFRLIVIEEKEIVCKDFPIPLINRLEKHYLDINTFLKKEHKTIVNELVAWVKDFTNYKKSHTDKTQTYKPSDVFIGYHSDTCASIVLQVTENMKHTENITDVKSKAVQILLNCATPDAVIRSDQDVFIDDYFKKQKHSSLLDFLCGHMTTGRSNTIFTEVTTFSRLLTSADKNVLETELQSYNKSIEILSLQQFDTEFSFLKKIRSFLKRSSRDPVLIIQTDFEDGSQAANLVASAKYSAVNEIQKLILTNVSVFVYFITKLPRMQGGTSYVGFRGGLWQSVHIDDLRKSKDIVEDIAALQNLTVSYLFSTEEKKEPVTAETKRKTIIEIEKTGEVTPRNEEGDTQGQGDGEDMEEDMEEEILLDTEDKMEFENESAEDLKTENKVPLPRPEDVLDTTTLIRSCVQNAIGLLRDDGNVESRNTRRVEILISLLSTEDPIKSSFLKILKSHLHRLLKAQEEVIYPREQWVVQEAANQDALQEAGTFRQTLWKRVQRAVTPLLSQIVSVVDCNANLDLLLSHQVEDYVKCLWMHIFQDECLLHISDHHRSQTETTLVKNYMNISVFGENRLPFSWRIKDYLEDLLSQAHHIDNAEASTMKFLEIVCKTPLGKYISSQEENVQHNIFLNYKRDFILMTMSISSDDELKIMEMALSTCIEELRASRKFEEPLLLPWVHIGYMVFQHRLQNLKRILVASPSVVDHLLKKDPKTMPRSEMVMDISAAIACLELLKQTVLRSDPQEWMKQVKNIQVPIELACSDSYLQGEGSVPRKKGIKQIRILWNSVFAMALFMEHLLVEENIQDENMQALLRRHLFHIGQCLNNFEDIKRAKSFQAFINVVHNCRTDAESATRESKERNMKIRKQCNAFSMDMVCSLCFKDNSPPDAEVIHDLLSFLFNNADTESEGATSPSPFEDDVDRTPVIRSVILKLLLKYSFDQIMKHVQEYLERIEKSTLLSDTKEVYVLFINSLEDSLYEKKQKVLNDNGKLEYFKAEESFLQNMISIQGETSAQLLHDVARVRLALDAAAEMMSVKPRGTINEQYLGCVKDLCSRSGNDWYRVYLIRKLANLDGIDIVQQHFTDPAFEWLFPQGMFQNKEIETNQLDHFLVCGESYKVLREGVSKAMMEGEKDIIETAMKGCESLDQELPVHLLLAVFREITLYYEVRNNSQEGMSPEQMSVKDFIKNTEIFQDESLNRFLKTLLNNSRPFLHAAPDIRGTQATIFGFAVHLAVILLSVNNQLLAPLKNLSFSSTKMKNSYLPTMPEDMFTQVTGALIEKNELQWYICPNGHYFALGDCGRPWVISKCPDCGASIGGKLHVPATGVQKIEKIEDRTKTGHVLGDPDHQGSAVAPDRDISSPAFILLRMVTHLAMLLGSEEDTEGLMCIVKPPVQEVPHFIFRHIERDLEYLKNSLGKGIDDTTTVVHLVLNEMLTLPQPGLSPDNFDEVWSTKEMRNSWEKDFVSEVITPVFRSLDRDPMTVNDRIRQDERISSNPVVRVVYGDPLISGEKMDLPRDSNVYCSKIWSCRERISIEYILHAVQQKDGKDTLLLLRKFLEKETELQMVKYLPDILKLQNDLVKKFQNYKDIEYTTIEEFIRSFPPGGARNICEKRVGEFMLAWNHLRLSLQTNGEIKLPEGMCDEILTMDSKFGFLLPRRQGLGLGATALTSYLIALQNHFIYDMEKYFNIEQRYFIKASEVMGLHVIRYELEKDLMPIFLSNCQYSVESGKETLQEFDFPKMQHQLANRLFQGKPRITMVGLPTVTLSQDRNYENLFTGIKKRLPQKSLSNSAIDVLSKDLNAFTDVCEALNIVDITMGFLATSGGDPELSLTAYVKDVLQMGEQSSEHVLEALRRYHLKNTIALWQLLTALKSQHLLYLNKDPFANVDKAYKQKLEKESQHVLNVFLEQNGTNLLFLELHEMILLKLGNQKSADVFRPAWILRDVLFPLLEKKGISLPELENAFPGHIALGHCIEAWKVTASKKWNCI